MRNQIKARCHKASGFLIACILFLCGSNCYAGSVDYVSEWQYRLIKEEGMEVKCTQVMCEECISWNWRDKDDHTYRRLSCGPAPVVADDPTETPEDPPIIDEPIFIGFEEDEAGIIKIPLAYCRERVSSETHDWKLIDNGRPDVAKVWLQALPEAEGNTNLGIEVSRTEDDGSVTNVAPMIGCNIRIAGEETYYVWIRGEGPDAAADSVNYGINGDRIATITFLHRPWSNYTQYTNTRAVADLTPGDYKFNIWMREDSVKVVIAILTTDPDYVPKDADYGLEN